MVTDEMIKAVTAELIAHGEFGSTEESNRANATAAAKAVFQIAISASPAPVAAGDADQIVDKIWSSTFVSHPYTRGDTWVPQKRAKAAIRLALERSAAPTPPAPAQPAAEPIGFIRKGILNVLLRSGTQGSVFVYRHEGDDRVPIYAAPAHVAAEAPLPQAQVMNVATKLQEALAYLEIQRLAVRTSGDWIYQGTELDDNGDYVTYDDAKLCLKMIADALASQKKETDQRIRSALASETEGKTNA